MSAPRHYDWYLRLRNFVGFSEEDISQLRKLGPVLIPEQPRITDKFYAAILAEPETAAFVDGKLDRLKRTHARWFEELFDGEYGEAYFQNRWRVGLAHVRVGLSNRWVDVVMTHVHEEALAILHELLGDDGVGYHRSLARLLELDRAIMQLAYDEDRLDRLSEFTGMKRTLIENVVRIAR